MEVHMTHFLPPGEIGDEEMALYQDARRRPRAIDLCRQGGAVVRSLEQNLRIGWIGIHMEGIPALKALLESGVRVEGVITLKAEARSRRCGSVEYTSGLRGFDLPVYEVGNINDDEAIAVLNAMSLDIAFVIGWGQLLRPETLATARMGMIGAHASLLPHNRGSAPINWALIKGETCTGNSLIWLSDSVDSGHLIDQVEIPISVYDTCASLYEKVAQSNRQMILRLVPRLLAGERPGRAQSPTDGPILPRRRPADGLVDWTLEAGQIYNYVRALTRPYPGAFSWLEGRCWRIWNCAVLPETKTADTIPGQIVGPVFSPLESACGQMVSCGTGAIVQLELEGPEGEILRGRELSNQGWERKVWTNG
ncbi:MAG: hypothetical protein DMG05_13195 [Acidobacteria bacterium]|nr:MAG: hypothetical protein DMG05_13195 [Acidobacteriota bacterium]